MTSVREMPVLAAARFTAITDKRLWRIVDYCVDRALEGLGRCISDKHTLIDEVAARQLDRNAHNANADWQSITKDARIDLKHLYPAIRLNRATRAIRPSGAV
jgi:hypothetical protein